MLTDLPVTRAPARAQCPRCSRFVQRGGTVLPRRFVCSAFDDDAATPSPALVVVEALAVDLANKGRCPLFAPFDQLPDAYRAKDLP